MNLQFPSFPLSCDYSNCTLKSYILNQPIAGFEYGTKSMTMCVDITRAHAHTHIAITAVQLWSQKNKSTVLQSSQITSQCLYKVIFPSPSQVLESQVEHVTSHLIWRQLKLNTNKIQAKQQTMADVIRHQSSTSIILFQINCHEENLTILLQLCTFPLSPVWYYIEIINKWIQNIQDLVMTTATTLP